MCQSRWGQHPQHDDSKLASSPCCCQCSRKTCPTWPSWRGRCAPCQWGYPLHGTSHWSTARPSTRTPPWVARQGRQHQVDLLERVESARDGCNWSKGTTVTRMGRLDRMNRISEPRCRVCKTRWRWKCQCQSGWQWKLWSWIRNRQLRNWNLR